MNRPKISVIIPAYNEHEALSHVLRDLPWDILKEVVVVDNGSTDGTGEAALRFGARVIKEPRRGYGFACLAGIGAIDDTDIVVFLDADYSDYPDELRHLVEPIILNESDLVIGSRIRGVHEKGSITPPQFIGNLLATTLVRLIYRKRFTDLGPFRAIRWSSLKKIVMQDTNFGWTVEMQILAIKHGLRIKEIPVSYRRRIGRSKISGTVKGVLGAGAKIMITIAMHALKPTIKKPQAVIIEFVKYPRAGHVKTRLAAEIGAEAACHIYKKMAMITHRELVKLQEDKISDLIVYADGSDVGSFKRWLPQSDEIWPQPEGDLGVRLGYVFQRAFDLGYRYVAAVGTDCPGLDANKIRDAIGRLKKSDVVIVPAKDGGYALIGTNRFYHELFRAIPWSSGKVFEKTLKIAKMKNLAVAITEPEADIDTKEDLAKVKNILDPKISVIIPVLNDHKQLTVTLESFSEPKLSDEVEIVIVDGGSDDGLINTGNLANVKIITSGQGRSKQMNLGVYHSKGKWLWFLHADCRPEKGSILRLLDYLDTDHVKWGFFRQTIEDDSIWFRMIEKGNELRARILGLPYGDQGIIIRKNIFHESGGFQDVPFLEDVILSSRLRSICLPKAMPYRLILSHRHWTPLGLFRTTARNILIVLRFLLLCQSPEILFKRYTRYGVIQDQAKPKTQCRVHSQNEQFLGCSGDSRYNDSHDNFEWIFK